MTNFDPKSTPKYDQIGHIPSSICPRSPLQSPKSVKNVSKSLLYISQLPSYRLLYQTWCKLIRAFSKQTSKTIKVEKSSKMAYYCLSASQNQAQGYVPAYTHVPSDRPLKCPYKAQKVFKTPLNASFTFRSCITSPNVAQSLLQLIIKIPKNRVSAHFCLFWSIMGYLDDRLTL